MRTWAKSAWAVAIVGIAIVLLRWLNATDTLSLTDNAAGDASITDVSWGGDGRIVCVAPARARFDCTTRTAALLVRGVAFSDVQADWVGDRRVVIKLRAGRIKRFNPHVAPGIVVELQRS